MKVVDDELSLREQARKKIIEALNALTHEGHHDPRFHEVHEAETVHVEPNEFKNLSDRERQILMLIAEKISAREIGKRISLSQRTVEWHRDNIRNKLKVKSSRALVRVAIQWRSRL